MNVRETKLLRFKLLFRYYCPNSLPFPSQLAFPRGSQTRASNLHVVSVGLHCSLIRPAGIRSVISLTNLSPRSTEEDTGEARERSIAIYRLVISRVARYRGTCLLTLFICRRTLKWRFYGARCTPEPLVKLNATNAKGLRRDAAIERKGTGGGAEGK